MTTSDNGHHEPDIDDHSGIETTGHEWDGIKELNNPLPRWWLIIFYVTIAWAFVYYIFMPSFPGLKGIRNHSERVNVTEDLATLREARSELASRLLTTASLESIEQDNELRQFAMAAGKSAFGDNCATCHGVGGVGYPGYPSLADDVWLWGGTLDDIRLTITHGIRSADEEARFSQMPAYGEQGMLSGDQINDLATYVLNYSEPQVNEEALARAEPLFQQQCSICHAKDGTGDQSQGAPNLTDAEWLYGGDYATIRAQIWNGRNGIMPNWGERLDDATIASLAVYVHSLGGGETSPQASLETGEPENIQ
ncbi:cytochrome-c oxidase, cbb3-type subunit III [Parvularcula marina]|uniref:cytochrome-c oxidase, cbb3-type subunit III n=1 Tax=Parvularcula marina TaxID=2292771 RepID=UPI0035157B14